MQDIEKYGKIISREEFNEYIKISNSEINAKDVSLKESTQIILNEIDSDFEKMANNLKSGSPH